MPDLDRTKVIKGLEDAYRVIEDYVPSRYRGYSRLACCDAIDLLREQEPVEPHVEHDNDDDSWYYGCGACHEAIDYKDKFCRHCGLEVKWDVD